MRSNSFGTPYFASTSRACVGARRRGCHSTVAQRPSQAAMSFAAQAVRKAAPALSRGLKTSAAKCGVRSARALAAAAAAAALAGRAMPLPCANPKGARGGQRWRRRAAHMAAVAPPPVARARGPSCALHLGAQMRRAGSAMARVKHAERGCGRARPVTQGRKSLRRAQKKEAPLPCAAGVLRSMCESHSAARPRRRANPAPMAPTTVLRCADRAPCAPANRLPRVTSTTTCMVRVPLARGCAWRSARPRLREIRGRRVRGARVCPSIAPVHRVARDFLTRARVCAPMSRPTHVRPVDHQQPRPQVWPRVVLHLGIGPGDPNLGRQPQHQADGWLIRDAALSKCASPGTPAAACARALVRGNGRVSMLCPRPFLTPLLRFLREAADAVDLTNRRVPLLLQVARRRR